MRNGLFSVLSTATSGLSNVLIQLLVAVLVGPVAFAEFTLVSATILVSLGLGRAIIGQTDMIRGAPGQDPGAVSAAYLFAGVTLVFGSLLLIVGGAFSLSFLVLLGTGLALSSVFTLQDAMRFRLLRTSRASWSFWSDLIVLVASLAGVGVLHHFGVLAQFAAHVWAGATFIGFVLVAFKVRYWPERGLGREWLAAHKDVITPMALEYGMQSALPYAVNWLLIILGGHGALAGYRIVQLAFAALSNFAQGLNAAVLPKIVNSADPTVARSRTRLEVAVLCASALLITTVMWWTPHSAGSAIFGAAWVSVGVFILPGALHGIANALSISNASMLRLMGLANFSLFVRSWTVALSLVFVTFGVLILGPVGAAWGLAAGAAIGYLARMIRSRQELSKRINGGLRLR